MGLWESKCMEDEDSLRIQAEKKRYMQMLLQQEYEALGIQVDEEGTAYNDEFDNDEDDDDDDFLDKCDGRNQDSKDSCTDEVDGRREEDDYKTFQSDFESTSFLNDVQAAALNVVPSEHRYPFENLVFEGGGNKGIAYVGVIQRLEELNMMGQFKRFSGASAGAITAALVALGYKSGQIRTFLSGNIRNVFLDHSWGYFSLLPNLIRSYGWNPGQRIHRWFGEKIRDSTSLKKVDLTFLELYEEKGVELCVVVTNVNRMSPEYCHPKTTPYMPIRDALRMTMSIPCVFAAQSYERFGSTDTYVDGGVLCNYPIHCFDGWYLSLAKEDALLRRFNNLKDLPKQMEGRFARKDGTENKTLGFLLYEEKETEVMRFDLENRIGAVLPEVPDEKTDLYRSKYKHRKVQKKALKEHKLVVAAMECFMKILQNHKLADKSHIVKQEIAEILNDKAFSKCHQEKLFGKDPNVDRVFAVLDRNCDKKITNLELLNFVQEYGFRMQAHFQSLGRTEFGNFFGFLRALQETMTKNLKFVYLKKEDLDRTVGINTGHVGSSDYSMEEEDRNFAIMRGYHATNAFLRNYIAEKQIKMEKLSQNNADARPIADTAEARDELARLLKS